MHFPRGVLSGKTSALFSLLFLPDTMDGDRCRYDNYERREEGFESLLFAFVSVCLCLFIVEYAGISFHTSLGIGS